jgi:serine/threonine protein kinase/Tol biopolymer transport system component
MTLAPGTRLGAYHILSAVGAGGMGEVYKARDTKLDRDVAIKVLPPAFAADPERIARLEREAKTLASLNHPNIAHIYGLEDSTSPPALVMEFVEGPTLADRIARGPVPIDEALPIARQIADALEASHEHGIIHRDLKPANIKVREDGTIKVLDFGLAKALEVGASGASSGALANSPTITSPALMTGVGVLLGTAAYMSPEQARGKTVDRRADIWAFGVVLFEMLSGRMAFDGDDLSITLASVLKTEPDWQTLPSATPVAIPGLLRRCLEKDPRRRLQAIGEARVQIENLLSGTPEEGMRVTPARPTPNSRARLAWALSAAALIAVVSVAAMAARLWWARPPAEPAKVSFDIITDSGSAPNQIALSADGTRLAATVGTPQGLAVWLRRLDDVSGQVLAGTVGATSPMPFWSPDSRLLAFFGSGKLNTIDLLGGPAVPLCDAPNATGGTWNRDEWILFAPADGPLFKCQTANGVPLPVTALDRARGDMAHQHPKFLPDGVHFIFLVLSTKLEHTGVYLGALNSPETRQLVATNEMGLFAAPDHLLFMRGGTVMAQRFDTRRLELAGDPFVVVAEGVGVSQTGNGVAGIAASDTGVLAYRIGNSLSHVLRWVDKTGTPLGTVGEPGSHLNVALAPDGDRVAETRIQGATRDVWITDLLRGGDSRFTSSPGGQDHAIWSPEGREIVFAAAGDGAVQDLYLGEPGSRAQAKRLLKSDNSKFPTDWAGDYILFTELKNSGDVWVLPRSTGKPFPFLTTASNETFARVSPDGRWVAYASNESGAPQVYVQAFPHGGNKVPVSITSGTEPHWRGDGRELFYATGDPVAIWAVDVLTTNATDFKVGVPHKLFDVSGLYTPGLSVATYDVRRDGQRFLLNTSITNTSFADRPIRVVVNWTTPSKP